MSADTRVLVGDIGGTHARFALVDTAAKPWRIEHRLDIDGDLPEPKALLRRYLDRAGLAAIPEAAAVAVAGPVTAGKVRLTNRGWEISEDELRAFGFADGLLINDFAALAFSIAALEPTEVHLIGPNLAGLGGEPISVIGAGTGFGAACLARFRGRSVPVATEGGHASFAAGDAHETAVAQILGRRFGHVSIERVLSGPGLENLYTALAEVSGRASQELRAADIAARHDSDTLCRDAVEMFCAIYGAVAGDFALLHGARGGVYIAGGIAAKIETILKASAFRARFEAKGRMAPYVRAIPTHLIVSEDTAFLGAASASLEFRGE
ncbi:MAG TPA: glucokinase [Rhizomicrobium sp.]